jgi:hypothetical protein
MMYIVYILSFIPSFRVASRLTGAACHGSQTLKTTVAS